MRIFYVLMALILLPTILFCQKADKTAQPILQIETGFSNPKFYIDNERVSKKLFANQIAINPDANKYFKRGKRLSIAEYVFGFIGGFGIGRGLLVPFLTNTPIDFKSLGAGVGFIGLGSITHNLANKAFIKSTDIYRDNNIGEVQKVKLGLCVASNGVSLKMRF